MFLDFTCKRGSVGQSEGLLIPTSLVRFRLKPKNSNFHGYESHRPSIKSTKLLLKVTKAIIIINALLKMLTATGQYQGISHGLQIGKNQEDRIQDTDHGYQFNNIGFIDDILNFAEKLEGMQTLLHPAPCRSGLPAPAEPARDGRFQ